MERFRLAGLALLAVCAFTAVVASGASAEALLLVLPGETISGLEYTGTTGVTRIEDSGATPKVYPCTKAKAAATFEAKEAKTADSELGKATLDFEGCKKEKVNCRSEVLETEKDPAETILVTTGLIGSAGTTENGKKEVELRYELIYLLKANLNCGGVKEEIKGSFACNVTPANGIEVSAGGTITITCTQERGKQVAGTCTEPAKACEDLKNNPLLCNFGGGFIACGLLFTVTGALNKMVSYDD